MEFVITNKNLVELYEKGKNRKYRILHDVQKHYSMRIQQIEAAQTICDLMVPPLHFEKLQGYKNRYSLRVTLKWRLEFEIEWKNEEKTIGKIYICELSQHYGD